MIFECFSKQITVVFLSVNYSYLKKHELIIDNPVKQLNAFQPKLTRLTNKTYKNL